MRNVLQSNLIDGFGFGSTFDTFCNSRNCTNTSLLVTNQDRNLIWRCVYRIHKVKVRDIAKRKCDRIAAMIKSRFDKKKLPPKKFAVGDLVLVERTKLVRGLTSGKLVPKYLAPVSVTEELGNERYRVESLS